MGLESLEARIVVHEKNEAIYKEVIAFLKYDVQVKDISIKYLKNQLEEALKEKDDLKLKLEKFEESTKNLTKLINSQISAKDKAGLGYDSQMNKSEVVHSVFNSRESDVDNSHVNDRFKTGEGFHVVPPPYTRNYMPSTPDLFFTGLDDFVYKTKMSETITTSLKTSKDNLEKPKTIRSSAPIIEDWDTNSDTNRKMLLSPQHAGFGDQQEMLLTIPPKTDQRIFDSGCSRHMTGNKSFLTDYQEIDGGFVAFGGSPKGGKITRKGKIRTGKLDFKDVYFVKELKFNLFCVSQMCDKKNNVLFTETERLVLSPDFKLLDESQVLLKVPTHNNMYSFDLKNVVPLGDSLGKFDGKADEGFFVVYFINSKAFKVFNTRTRRVEENLHITFLENKPNVVGSGPDWLFDINLLINSMNYEPVTAGNQTNKNAVADDDGKKTNEKPANEGERNGQEKEGRASNKEDYQNVQDFKATLDNLLVQQKEGYSNSTNRDSTVSPSVSTAEQSFTNADDLPIDPIMPDLEDTANLLNTVIFSGAYDNEDVGAEADLNNLETTMNVSPIPTTRIHKDHPKDQIIRDINLATQTRRMTKISDDPQFPDKVYKVEKVLYCLHQAPRAWKDKDDAQEIPDEFYEGAYYLLRVTTSTLIETHKALLKNEEAEDLDVHLYRLMIGSLMYLTASRPDTVLVQVIMLDLALTGNPQQEAKNIEYMCVKSQIPKRGQDTKIPQFSDPPKKVGDEAIHKKLGDIIERVATTASSLEAKQDSGSSPRCQDTILGGAEAQTRFKAASKQSNDPHSLKKS
ncbi:putative ribonuclease H-like domain-containing protein [Tanacetum coccineum]